MNEHGSVCGILNAGKKNTCKFHKIYIDLNLKNLSVIEQLMDG